GNTRNDKLRWLPWIAGRHYRKDDRAPMALAKTLGCPATELPVALTGGNLAFDGQGTAFATRAMLDENRDKGISEGQFLAIVGQELGVQRFCVLPNIQRLGIQHLDCLLKLLDEERILVKRVPANHPEFSHVERVVCELSQLTNVYGRPYQVLRIDTPRYQCQKLTNYTNSLIVNRTIFVPLFGIPADDAALCTWREAMPGYDVQGFEY